LPQTITRPGLKRKRYRSYPPAALFLLAVFCFAAITSAPAVLGIIKRGPATEPLVALTFDDGPDPVFTPQILDILQHEGVPATFFVVGEGAALQPELVLRLAAGGFELANHTYTHARPGMLSRAETRAEIARTTEIIQDLTGQNPRYLRPPRGEITPRFWLEARRQDLGIALWTIAVENQEMKTPAAMARRIIENTQNGYIILLHDGRLDRQATVQALPLIIKGLKERGFGFVTLSQLLDGDSTQSNKNPTFD